MVVGHLTEDRGPGGPLPGGVAAYGSLVASRLGCRTAVVTRAGKDLDLTAFRSEVDVFRLASTVTTVMEHSSRGLKRNQYVRSQADPIEAGDIPEALRGAPIVLLGPVISEVDPAIIDVFPDALAGATAQGWLRRQDATGRVTQGHVGDLDVSGLAGRLTLLSLSDEDLAGATIPTSWREAFPVIVVTQGRRGLRLRHEGRWWSLAVFPAVERDGTGAGDAFAAAFLVRYAESGNVGEAARFGAATASFVVEAPGISGAPSRAAVDRRLAQHPEVQLSPLF